jgi:hypothetical protein
MLNELFKKLFGVAEIKSEQQISNDFKSKNISRNKQNQLRFFYARNWKKKEKVVSVVRRINLDKKVVHYAFCMNDPREDRFCKKTARDILSKRIIENPIRVYLKDSQKPIEAIVHNMLKSTSVSNEVKSLIRKWWYRFYDVRTTTSRK